VVLLSFLAGLVFILVALAVCVVRGVRLWRQTRATGKAFSAETARFAERSAKTERLLARNEAASKELEAAVARLQVSRARLAVLTGEIERARARTRWLRAFLPV
jgi:cytochrome c biogenesis protein ResB